MPRLARLAPLVLALPALAATAACRDERTPTPEPSSPAGSATPAASGARGLGTASGVPTSGGGAVVTQGGVMPKVGDAAPAFKARDHTGTMRSLADYRGKRVVLWFYPKASTGG